MTPSSQSPIGNLWQKLEAFCDISRAGLKITAGQRTMSGQNDNLSGQNFGSAVILTGHEHGSQINNTHTQKNSQYFLKFYSKIIKYHGSLQSQICRIQMRRSRSADLLASTSAINTRTQLQFELSGGPRKIALVSGFKKLYAPIQSTSSWRGFHQQDHEKIINKSLNALNFLSSVPSTLYFEVLTTS